METNRQEEEAAGSQQSLRSDSSIKPKPCDFSEKTDILLDLKKNNPEALH